MPSEVAESPRPTEPEAVAPRPPRWQLLRRFRLRYVLAALPPIGMAALIRSGTRLQYNDYWFMIAGTFEPDGGLDVGGLFTFVNHHPVVVPKLVYWLNAHLAAGSNLALGWFVVLLSLTGLFLVGRLVDDRDWPTWAAGGLVVTASVLLFSRQGAWNFFPAMSGTAWFSANVLVLAALVAAFRDRMRLAVGVGVVASMAYGTGLLVWPALLVQRMVRRRTWRPDARLLAITVVVGITYVVLDRPVSEAERAATGNTLDLQSASPWATVRAAGELLGAIFDPSAGYAQALGLGAVVVGALLAVAAVRDDARRAAPWVALLVYSTGAALLIGRTRADLLEQLGQQSRYTSIAALFWIAIAGLVVLSLHHRRIAVVPLAALAVAAALTGSEAVDTSRDFLPAQEELAATIHLDLADGFGAQAVAYPRVAPLLDELGNYPFDGSFDGDCGLAGQRVIVSPGGGEDAGRLASGRALANGRGVRLQGWVAPERVDDVACVLLVNDGERVVGYGALGVVASDLPTLPQDETFAAVAPVGAGSWRAVLVYDDGVVDLLGGRVLPTELQGAPVPG